MQRCRLHNYGGLKFFIVPSDLFAHSIPMKHIAKRLESHHKTDIANVTDSPIFFEKTNDLQTTGGIIYLNHDDYLTLHEDLTFLRSVEHHAFSQVISTGLDKPTIKKESYNPNSIKKLLTDNTVNGTTLLITDEFIDNPQIVQCKLNKVDEVSGNFEIVLLD